MRRRRSAREIVTIAMQRVATDQVVRPRFRLWNCLTMR